MSDNKTKAKRRCYNALAPLRAAYDAASHSPEAERHFRSADMLSADAALSASVRQTVISRSRYETANNGDADGILLTLAEDTIGTGPHLQLTLTEDAPEADEDALRRTLQRRERRFKEWADAVQLTEKLKLARIAKARDGEVFIRLVRNPKVQSLAKFSITLFEAEQVGSRILDAYAQYYEEGTIREFDGIVFDRYGNPESYRFWKIHPGAAGLAFVSEDSYVVPAEQVIQYAHIMRPGQHRGMSEFASTLNNFNDVRRYSNATLTAAEIAAEISFLLKTNAPADDYGEDGKPVRFMDIVELVRGAGLALPEGYDAMQMKAEHPIDRYVDYVNSKKCDSARPFGMPYEIASGDYSRSSYASGRLGLQVYHKRIIGERTLIAGVILDRLLREFEKYDSIVYPEDYTGEKMVLHSWVWDGWEHVDPVKEANAQAQRLASGVTTLADECAKDGKDYELVLRQIQRERRLMQRLGITTPAPDTGADNEGETDGE